MALRLSFSVQLIHAYRRPNIYVSAAYRMPRQAQPKYDLADDKPGGSKPAAYTPPLLKAKRHNSTSIISRIEIGENITIVLNKPLDCVAENSRAIETWMLQTFKFFLKITS